MIPKQDIYKFYMGKATSPIPNRFENYLKKFRKIEKFIKEHDAIHKDK